MAANVLGVYDLPTLNMHQQQQQRVKTVRAKLRHPAAFLRAAAVTCYGQMLYSP